MLDYVRLRVARVYRAGNVEFPARGEVLQYLVIGVARLPRRVDVKPGLVSVWH
jgi:hypothetical protein